MKTKRGLLLLLTALLATGVAVFAQRRGRAGRGFDGGWSGGYESAGDFRKTAREYDSNSTGTPVWENPPEFKDDVFTFTRIRYKGHGGRRGWGGGGWAIDLPDSDLNLSWRLQQMTSMKVDPDGRIIEPTDPELMNYPFIYIVEPGKLYFTDEDAEAMRKYLLNGGFLMFDDFWGEDEWENCAENMRRVFPDREFVEIPLDHPLYHCVFEIKSKGQVPAINLGISSEFDGVTWERHDAREVHHRGIFDDKGRLMVFAAHNTDNGDGWEREGESAYYFHTFSEKIAYPLAVNLLFHVMTH